MQRTICRLTAVAHNSLLAQELFVVCFAHFPRVHVPDSDYSDTCNCQGTVGICICSNEYNVKVGVFVHRSCLKKYGTDNFRNGHSVPAAIRCLRERAITMEEFKAARPCKIYCPSSMRQRLCGFSHTRQGDTRTLTSRLVWVWLAGAIWDLEATSNNCWGTIRNCPRSNYINRAGICIRYNDANYEWWLIAKSTIRRMMTNSGNTERLKLMMRMSKPLSQD